MLTQATPEILEDETLIRRVQKGDRAAFDLLFARYQRGLYFLCLRMCGKESEAQDLCQRAFLRAFTGLNKFRGDSSFRTWLYRIAINLSKNFLRDSGRRAEVAFETNNFEIESKGKSALEQVLDEEKRKKLHKIIDTLPQKQKAILQLRIYEDLSFAEIAKAVGTTENAAKVNFHYAIKNLKKTLQGREKHEM